MMITSRKIEDLLPAVQLCARDFLARCLIESIDILVTSTYRDKDVQAALYAQGRTSPGRIVTNARPGQSWHNHRCAFDVVPLRQGKPVWGTEGKDLDLWHTVGELGEAAGLEWAGRWKRFKEFPHFQYTGGLTLAQVAAGGRIT